VRALHERTPALPFIRQGEQVTLMRWDMSGEGERKRDRQCACSTSVGGAFFHVVGPGITVGRMIARVRSW
jgi:hypothetical protein